MRSCLKTIVDGGEVSLRAHAYAACGDVIPKCKAGFDEFTEPTDESALSEKEGKARGCC